MPAKVEVRYPDEATRDQRREWAARVLDYFDGKLPDIRLLIFVDAEDAKELIDSLGKRGHFEPINKDNFDPTDWPWQVAEKLYTLTTDLVFHYDAVVYVPNSTCETEASLTMTLAHELRHFIQFGFQRRVWAWNGVVTNLTKEVCRERGLAWKDIPVEYEARLYAKRLALEVLGPQRTSGYIADRIREHITDADAADWEFINRLDPALDCNISDMTKALFQNLADIRDKLQVSLEDMRKHFPEYRQMDLNEMLPKT
jgi:hypothetical protein